MAKTLASFQPWMSSPQKTKSSIPGCFVSVIVVLMAANHMSISQTSANQNITINIPLIAVGFLL